MTDARFERVGIRPAQAVHAARPARRLKGRPVVSAVLLCLIVLGCLGCELFIPRDPTQMDLANYGRAPGAEFLFGTDTMGRDIFSMIWYGGRVSLTIGVLATVISTAIALIFGALSGLAPSWLDETLMRLTEVLLSVPSLLLVILIQAILGRANLLSLSLVIGLTSWFSIAKVVRTEVLKLRHSEYLIAARLAGAGFFRILWRHLAPNLVSSIMFMVVMNLRSAIVAESTLSFMGVGLPLEVISWGSMLSLSEKALSSGAWWMILIPGAFLLATLLCVTELGNDLRRRISRSESKL